MRRYLIGDTRTGILWFLWTATLCRAPAPAILPVVAVRLLRLEPRGKAGHRGLTVEAVLDALPSPSEEESTRCNSSFSFSTARKLVRRVVDGSLAFHTACSLPVGSSAGKAFLSCLGWPEKPTMSRGKSQSSTLLDQPLARPKIWSYGFGAPRFSFLTQTPGD